MGEEQHHIDEYFRDALKDYRKKSSVKTWKNLNQRLELAKQADKQGDTHFKEVSPSVVVTLLHKPWFRLAVAAVFSLLIIFSYAIVKQWKSLNSNNNGNIGQKEQKITGGHDASNTDLFIADNDKIWIIPFRDAIIPLTNDLTSSYAENSTTGKDIAIEPSNDQKDKQDNMPYRKHWKMTPEKSYPLLTDNSVDETNKPVQPGYSIQSNQPASSNEVPVVTMNEKDDKPNHKDKEPLNQNNESGKLQLPDEGEQVQDNDGGFSESRPGLNDAHTSESIVIPNVFTPNGDGKNDYFEILNIEQCITNQLVISDRNGRIIYEKTNYMNDWDASGVPSGVYYYLLVYKIADENISKRGVLHIYR